MIHDDILADDVLAAGHENTSRPKGEHRANMKDIAFTLEQISDPQ